MMVAIGRQEKLARKALAQRRRRRQLAKEQGRSLREKQDAEEAKRRAQELGRVRAQRYRKRVADEKQKAALEPGVPRDVVELSTQAEGTVYGGERDLVLKWHGVTILNRVVLKKSKGEVHPERETGHPCDEEAPGWRMLIAEGAQAIANLYRYARVHAVKKNARSALARSPRTEEVTEAEASLARKEEAIDRELREISCDEEKMARRYHIGMWVAQGNQAIGLTSDTKQSRGSQEAIRAVVQVAKWNVKFLETVVAPMVRSGERVDAQFQQQLKMRLTPEVRNRIDERIPKWQQGLGHWLGMCVAPIVGFSRGHTDKFDAEPSLLCNFGAKAMFVLKTRAGLTKVVLNADDAVFFNSKLEHSTEALDVGSEARQPRWAMASFTRRGLVEPQRLCTDEERVLEALRGIEEV